MAGRVGVLVVVLVAAHGCGPTEAPAVDAACNPANSGPCCGAGPGVTLCCEVGAYCCPVAWGVGCFPDGCPTPCGDNGYCPYGRWCYYDESFDIAGTGCLIQPMETPWCVSGCDTGQQCGLSCCGPGTTCSSGCCVLLTDAGVEDAAPADAGADQ
jgi:hypothetical protein